MTTIKPSLKPAERGESTKVLMPLLDNKLPVRFGKLLCPSELSHLALPIVIEFPN